jgi:uncharacterized membrane protein YccF (DUF307 family)
MLTQSWIPAFAGMTVLWRRLCRPFAWAHLKLAGIALWPIGKTIVPKDQAMPGHRV